MIYQILQFFKHFRLTNFDKGKENAQLWLEVCYCQYKNQHISQIQDQTHKTYHVILIQQSSLNLVVSMITGHEKIFLCRCLVSELISIDNSKISLYNPEFDS